MSESSINSLLENLKNLDENVRQQATEELWRIWFYQKIFCQASKRWSQAEHIYS